MLQSILSYKNIGYITSSLRLASLKENSLREILKMQNNNIQLYKGSENAKHYQNIEKMRHRSKKKK